MATGVESVGTTTSAADVSKATASKAKLADDLDSFMNLLVTQLKNQDPLDPMDTNEFTNQLVQFASVEQQIQANANLESLVSLQKSSHLANVVSYIDKGVEAETDQVPVENGSAKFSYTLAGESKSTTITIRNSAGTSVFTAAGEVDTTRHEFTWNGQDKNGNQVADGVYTVTVSALNDEGDPIDVSQTAFGRVTSVTAEGGKTVVSMSGIEVDAEKIIAIASTQP